MNRKEIILVTGQSGVHIKDCLKRIDKSFISDENIISMQDKIAEISKMPFREFLGAPQHTQYKYWLKAWRKIVQEDIRAKSSVKPLFLAFHAGYYHQQKREFFSPIDIKELQKLKKLRKIKMLIVFIDDIYDLYRRLMDKGEMYENILKRNKTSALEAIFSSIFNIIILLNWREIEIAFSRFIAKFLGNIPMFIVSTKHPSFMINRLIEKPFDELKFYYLSHPITTVRQESKQYLSSFIGHLESVIDAIISDKNTVLFFPTSIDELIIEREKISEGKYFYWPKLDKRWAHPYPPEDLLSPPLSTFPTDLSSINPLNPQKYKVSQKKKDPTASAISQLLSLLWDFIYLKQIISRDYSLVEQSENGIIVCRPYLYGIKADGVMGEIKYNLVLMKEEKRREKAKRKCFIFSCKEDLSKYTIYSFFEKLKKSLKENCSKDIEKTLDALRNSWLNNHSVITKKNSESICREMEKIALNLDLKDGDFSRWESDDMKREVDERKLLFSESWEGARDDPIQIMINEISAHKVKDNVQYEKYIEEKFFSRIQNKIKNKKGGIR